jgi:hypothetical protein
VTQYRKKPVVIEAMEWDGTIASARNIRRAFGDDVLIHDYPHTVAMGVRTLEGELRATVGDYIIKGVKGEVYPCKPDVFAITYGGAR